MSEASRSAAQPTIAPLGRRSLAAVVDIAISSGLAMIALMIALLFFTGIFYAIGFGGAIEDFKEGHADLSVVLFVIIACLACVLALASALHGYYIYYETKFGATPGKKLLGLKVVSIDGSVITREQAITRDLIRWYVDGLFVFPAFISMAVTKQRQRVGDLAARTIVISEADEKIGENFVYVSRERFEKLSQALSPGPVPNEARARFLAFAYRALMHGTMPEAQADYVQWVAFARAHLRGSEGLNLNDNTVLRFFAELCFQQQSSKH